jgi:hypothetical protein
MKWVIGAIAVLAVTVLNFSIPETIVSTKAYASKMNGKPYGAAARSRRAACFENSCKKK